MDRKRLTRSVILWTAFVLGAVAVIVAAVALTRSDTLEASPGSEIEPAEVTHLQGRNVSSVRLTPQAAGRIGLRLVRVRGQVVQGSPLERRRSVPYSALVYDQQGRVWVYTRPKRLTFVRAPVVVDSIRGSRAVLSAGPPVGTVVVAVGAAELLGSEFEVGH